MTDGSSIMTAAATAWAAGLSVIPIRPGTEKRPAISWKGNQTTRAELDQLAEWFRDGTALGLGLVTGYDRLELFEIEGRAADAVPLLAELATTSGLADVWARISTGWVETSPSGGIHYHYRIADDGQPVPSNTKIARRPATEAELAENPDERIKVLVETRGTGGYFVAAPTPGTFHETGRPWALTAGGPHDMPTLTRDERDRLHALAHTVLDEMPAPAPVLDSKWADPTPRRADGDITPGDDFEAKTSWPDILEPHGWTIVTQRGTTTYWCRPGKTGGISATTGRAADRDRLYVFSSSTDFPQEEPVTKLGAHAILNHRGDMHAAARDLAARGYGHRAERHLKAVDTPTPARDLGPASADEPATTGALALARPVTIHSGPDQLTDVGNATLTRDAWHGRLVYVPDARRWAEWDGTRWDWRADDATALQAVLATIKALPDDAPDLAAHRKRSMSARSLSNAVAILRTEPAMRANADEFDQQPLQLNTPSGVIDLTTGDTLPAHPRLYHSKQTATGPAESPSPRWDAFMSWAMGDDRVMIGYLQRLVGLSLLGDVREHVLPFLHGKGANGKSVFLETIAAVLGDYATEAPNNLLLRGPDRHPTELAVLQGRRFVTMSEINEGARFDEAKLKWLTGGDTITARFMRGDFFTFTPTHTLWIAANHRPKVTAGGDGFWRRIRIIHWAQQVAPGDRNENLKTELLEEADGILAWALAGLADYLHGGLQEPSQVIADTQAYSREEDHLGRFLDDRCRLGGAPVARIAQPELREAYRAWCRAEGEDEMNGTQFGRELKDRFGIETKASNGRKFYVGISLYAEETDDESTPVARHWSDR